MKVPVVFESTSIEVESLYIHRRGQGKEQDSIVYVKKIHTYAQGKRVE